MPAVTTAAIKAHPFYDQLVAAQRGHAPTARDVQAAGRDARRLDVGWVLVWKVHGPRRTRLIIAFLDAAEFSLDYRADGVMVYRPAGPGSGVRQQPTLAPVPARSTSSSAPVRKARA